MFCTLLFSCEERAGVTQRETEASVPFHQPELGAMSCLEHSALPGWKVITSEVAQEGTGPVRLSSGNGTVRPKRGRDSEAQERGWNSEA